MTIALPTAIIELQAWPHWVLWRTVERDGKPTKIPLQPNGKPASSTDPDTWSSHADCTKALERGRGDGVGYVFAPDDEYCGVDLDKCVEVHEAGSFAAAAGPNIDNDAWKIVRQLDSYTEFSPTGTGLHVIVRAGLNGGRKRTGKTPWGGEFESYDQARFFTITGRHVAGTPVVIEPRQKQLDAVRAELFPPDAKQNGRRPAPATTSLDDVAFEEKIRASKQGSKFAEFFDRGAPEGQESEADLGLCNILAFWIGPDEGRIDAWFRRSALMRDKWDSKRGETTYGGYTIARALEGRTEFYEQRTSRRRPQVADDREATDSEARACLGEFLGLDGRTVTHVTAGGRDTKARHDIHISDGSALTLDPLTAYTTAAKLGAEIAIQLGTMPRLSETVMTEVDGKRKERKVSHVLEVLTLIHQLREVREELTLDQRALDFGVSCLQTFPARSWIPGDQANRWASLLAMKDIDPSGAGPVGFYLLIDGDGRRYVRTGWFLTYVRTQSSPGVAEDVSRRMIALGWTRPGSDGRIKATNPNGPDKLSWNFWVVEPGWQDT